MKGMLSRTSSAFFIAFLLVVSYTKTNATTLKHDGNGLKFYISPNANPHSAEGQFSSFEEALLMLLKLKASNNKEDVTFIVKDGVYNLVSPILIDEHFADLGFKVAFTAENKGKAIISGCEDIKGFQTQKSNLLFLDSKNFKVAKNNQLIQLFVNERRVYLASTDFGKGHRLRNVSQKLISEPKLSTQRAIQQFKIAPNDFFLMSKLSIGELNQLYITFYLKWDVEIKRIDSVRVRDSVVFISGKPMSFWNPLDTNVCYQISNGKDFASQQGSYYYDNQKNIYYKPTNGSNLEQAIATIPVLDQLLIIKGAKDSKIKDFSFSGIGFAYTRYNLSALGYEPEQAALSIDAAIKINNAESITFEDCSIKHTGNYGIWFDVGCKYCKIAHCELSDLGAGGIRIGDPLQSDDQDLATSGNFVFNNIINGCGKIIPSAVAIHIGQSSYNAVSHNTISDLYYSGISVGWVWGYGKSQSHDNIITNNLVEYVGWGRLSDMAGIYNLGVSPNNMIENNIVHDVYAYSYGGWGIYTDEGSSQVTITNNLVYNTKSGSFHQNYGSNNLIQNNIFLNGMSAQLECTKVEDHNSFTFKNNLILWEKGDLMVGPWDEITAIIDSNLYCNTLGHQFNFHYKNSTQWKIMHDQHSLFANPGLEFDGDKKISFKNKAILAKINFHEFDLSQVGVIGADDWIAKSKIDEARKKEFNKLFTGL